jgi:hypothetical protein
LPISALAQLALASFASITRPAVWHFAVSLMGCSPGRISEISEISEGGFREASADPEELHEDFLAISASFWPKPPPASDAHFIEVFRVSALSALFAGHLRDPPSAWRQQLRASSGTSGRYRTERPMAHMRETWGGQ